MIDRWSRLTQCRGNIMRIAYTKPTLTKSTVTLQAVTSTLVVSGVSQLQ